MTFIVAIKLGLFRWTISFGSGRNRPMFSIGVDCGRSSLSVVMSAGRLLYCGKCPFGMGVLAAGTGIRSEFILNCIGSFTEGLVGITHNSQVSIF